MISEICLMVDYRDSTVKWWKWTENSKLGTTYNLFTQEKPLYTYYKIKNTLYEILHTLLTDVYAREKVLRSIDGNQYFYGEKFTILVKEKIILKRSLLDNEGYRVYRQKFQGELELL